MKFQVNSDFPFIHRLAPEKNTIDDRPTKENIPNGRQSQPDNGNGGTAFPGLYLNGRIVYPRFLRTSIPLIRQLIMMNPDLSQALHNICMLGNTGHKVFFDKNVSPELVEEMRNHLDNKRKQWAAGQAGMHGAINKMLAQLMIGGALSNEWVVNKKMNGVQGIAFINPEDIYFRLNEDNITYEPYQRPPFLLGGYDNDNSELGMIKLNPVTYKYYALNGDTDIPYGFPPYASVLKRIDTQKNMNTNIDFVVDLLGILGFLEVLLAKPVRRGGESETDYSARLETYLTEAKTRVAQGMKDGVVTGFEGDHTFKFNNFGKDFDKVMELYNNNELQIFSGIKQDPTLAGRSYNTSETQITVIFIKMLSELKNVQNILSTNLEYGYSLELLLAGFKFDSLYVEFNRSTIQDDLKYQQAEEIKVRNIIQKFIMGIISMDQAADELDYEKPDQAKPRVPLEVLAGKSGPAGAAQSKTTTQKKKTASDKKVRSKNKPVAKK